MTTREIETQFVLELPDEFRDTFVRHRDRMSAGLGAALAVLFGLPVDTPTRLSIRFSKRFQPKAERSSAIRLAEVNGHVLREPSPLEVEKTIMGAFVALLVALEARVHTVDLWGERVTDA